MKKFLLITIAAMMSLALFTGCSSEELGESEETGKGKLSGTVSANGSTSMEKLIAVLSEAFMAKNPDVVVTYEATGSGAGITAASEGMADIGLSSRDLKGNEMGLDTTVIAIDGIALIVNKENPVADLTTEQIAGLAKGGISNWKDVGGNDAPVVFIGREAGSGTHRAGGGVTGLRAGAVAGVAGGLAAQLERKRGPCGRFPEVQGDLRFDVGPPRRPSCVARTAAAVEKATEDIAQAAVLRKSSTGSSRSALSEDVRDVEVLRRLTKPAGKSGTSASAEATESAAAEHGLQLVVLLATFRVTDDVVGLGRLLEAVLGSFVTGVLVRVVLPGELPVGLLDVLGGGG